jgi:hypothetical protein
MYSTISGFRLYLVKTMTSMQFQLKTLTELVTNMATERASPIHVDLEDLPHLPCHNLEQFEQLDSALSDRPQLKSTLVRCTALCALSFYLILKVHYIKI